MQRRIVIVQGSALTIEVIQSDPLATDVTVILRNDETLDLITVGPESYSDGIAHVTIDAEDTEVVGTYSIQLNETTPEGVIKHGAFDCDGDGNCYYAKVIVCESLDGVE